MTVRTCLSQNLLALIADATDAFERLVDRTPFLLYRQGSVGHEVNDKFQLPFEAIADDGSGSAERYRVRVTPFGFVVGEDGRIRAKGLCNGRERLKELLVAGGLEKMARALEEADARRVTIDTRPRAIDVSEEVRF